MKVLTGKQLRIFNIIKDFINEYGYSPSIRELCVIADVKSTASIYDYLIRLRNKGYITYTKGKNRTIRVLEG